MIDTFKLEILKESMQYYDKPTKLLQFFNPSVEPEEVIREICTSLNCTEVQVLGFEGYKEINAVTSAKFVLQIKGRSLVKASMNRASNFSNNLEISNLSEKEQMKYTREFMETICFEEEIAPGDVIYIPYGHYHMIDVTEDCEYLSFIIND